MDSKHIRRLITDANFSRVQRQLLHNHLSNIALSRWNLYGLPFINLSLPFIGYSMNNVWYKAFPIVGLHEIIVWKADTDYLENGTRRQKTLVYLVWNLQVELQNNPSKVFEKLKKYVAKLYPYEPEFVDALIDAIFIQVSKQVRVNVIYITNIVSIGKRNNLSIEIMAYPNVEKASYSVFKQSIESARDKLLEFKERYPYVKHIICHLNVLFEILKSCK